MQVEFGVYKSNLAPLLLYSKSSIEFFRCENESSHTFLGQDKESSLATSYMYAVTLDVVVNQLINRS